jgi:hypothetical protein
MVSKSESMPLMFLKHRGTFNLSELMKAIQEWFVDNGYKFHAPKYKMKADEAEYEIIAERDITEYVRFRILLHIWVREMREVELVQDGEKKKMNSGMINLDVGGEYELDYQKRFGGNKFFQWLQDFYHKYVIRQTISDVWEDDLFLKMVQLMGLIKNKLGIEVS